VSILIPTTIGGTDPLVAEQARWLVQDFDTRVSQDFIKSRVFLKVLSSEMDQVIVVSFDKSLLNGDRRRYFFPLPHPLRAV
jgi:hypothetical protein